jgi:hypothetical protein
LLQALVTSLKVAPARGVAPLRQLPALRKVCNGLPPACCNPPNNGGAPHIRALVSPSAGLPEQQCRVIAPWLIGFSPLHALATVDSKTAPAGTWRSSEPLDVRGGRRAHDDSGARRDRAQFIGQPQAAHRPRTCLPLTAPRCTRSVRRWATPFPRGPSRRGTRPPATRFGSLPVRVRRGRGWRAQRAVRARVRRRGPRAEGGARGAG